jgi:hypothetical protein
MPRSESSSGWPRGETGFVIWADEDNEQRPKTTLPREYRLKREDRPPGLTGDTALLKHP